MYLVNKIKLIYYFDRILLFKLALKMSQGITFRSIFTRYGII